MIPGDLVKLYNSNDPEVYKIMAIYFGDLLMLSRPGFNGYFITRMESVVKIIKNKSGEK